VAVFLGVLGVVVSEGAIIAAVGLFGPPVAFAVLFVGCSAISILIAYAFDADEAKHGAAPLVGRTRAWIARKRTRAEERARQLAHLSEATAFVVLSVTVGPFLTAIVIKVRGTGQHAAYLMSVMSSAIFSAVWVAIYAGGLAVLGKALGR
jgi:hypothetical protein